MAGAGGRRRSSAGARRRRRRRRRAPPATEPSACTRASPSKPSNFTCLTVTSAVPWLATMTDTFTGCPGTTTPSSASASTRMPLATSVACWNSRSFWRRRKSISKRAAVVERPSCRSSTAQDADGVQAGEQRRAASRASLSLSNFFCAACTAGGDGGQARRRDPSAGGRRRTSRGRRCSCRRRRTASARPAPSGRESSTRRAGRSPPTARAARAAAPAPGTCACCALRCRSPSRSCRAADRTRPDRRGTRARSPAWLPPPGPADGEVELLRLPRPQAVLDLFRVLRRVAGQLERLARQDRGQRVMRVLAGSERRRRHAR